MRPKGWLLFVLMFLPVLFYALETDRQKDGLSGNVRERKESKYLASYLPGVNTNELVESFTDYYNREGMRVKWESFSRFGELRERVENRYDTKLRLIGRTEYGRLGKLRLFQNFRYVEENLSSIETYDEFGQDIQTLSRVYGTNGYLLEESGVDRTKKVLWKTVWLYDTNNVETGLERYDVEGKLIEQWNYSYSEVGRRISESRFDGEGNLLQRIEMEYEPTGRISVRREYMRGNILMREIRYKIDARGNERERKEYDRYRQLTTSIVNTYNRDGKIVERRASYPVDKISWKTLYQYDDKGNLSEVRKIELRGRSEIPHTVVKYDYTFWN